MMYNDYARYYDDGQLHFSVLMFDYLQRVLERHPVPGRSMIDLACGTGTLALMHADLGWDVLGIDASREMLRVAQRKARGDLTQQRSIRFRRADMRDWQVSQQVQLVTCFYDSLNYLLEESDLHATFACVAAALESGGRWVFDINTPYFLEHIWQPVEIDERDGYVHIMHSQFEPERCISWLQLTGFAQRDDGLFERFTEQHAERGYTQATLEHLLQANGFTIEAVYDCFVLTEPTPISHRWLWVCTKQ